MLFFNHGAMGFKNNPNTQYSRGVQSHIFGDPNGVGGGRRGLCSAGEALNYLISKKNKNIVISCRSFSREKIIRFHVTALPSD